MKKKIKQELSELLSEEKLSEQIKKNKSKAIELLKDKEKMDHFLERLEIKLSQIPLAGKYLSDVPTFISLVKAYISKEYTEIPIGSIIAIVGALIYVFSPIDLIPDILPVIGISDDAAVVGLVFKFVHGDVMEYREWRAKSREAATKESV